MTEGRCVLVVDDDHGMVDTLSDILVLNGWDAVRAYDGAEGVVCSSERDVNAVVMDVKMPRLNGVQALRAIKGRAPALPVILITAVADDELLAEANREGALAILRKPIDPDVLLGMLDGAVRKSA